MAVRPWPSIPFVTSSAVFLAENPDFPLNANNQGMFTSFFFQESEELKRVTKKLDIFF